MVRLAIWCKKSTLAPNKWESYVREPCMSGVSMMPGHTAMTRMPKRARSRACRCHSSVRAHYTPSAVTASGTHAHTHAHTHTRTHTCTGGAKERGISTHQGKRHADHSAFTHWVGNLTLHDRKHPSLRCGNAVESTADLLAFDSGDARHIDDDTYAEIDWMWEWSGISSRRLRVTCILTHTSLSVHAETTPNLTHARGAVYSPREPSAAAGNFDMAAAA